MEIQIICIYWSLVFSCQSFYTFPHKAYTKASQKQCGIEDEAIFNCYCDVQFSFKVQVMATQWQSETLLIVLVGALLPQFA